jgi:hypothetical protein
MDPINFITGSVEALLKHGIKRIVNRLDEPPQRAPLPRVPRVT